MTQRVRLRAGLAATVAAPLVAAYAAAISTARRRPPVRAAAVAFAALAAAAPAVELLARRLGRDIEHLERSAHESAEITARRDEQLDEALDRVGEALARALELDGLLTVTLESAVAAVGALGGAALVVSPAGELTPVSERTLPAGLRLPGSIVRGQGVLGRLLARPAVVRTRVGTSDLPAAPGEWRDIELLAAPLVRDGRPVAVLALVDDTPFTVADERRLAGLVEQAEVAIDNALLHREAQRLAITDPLTGLWNFRYLSISLAREIERAERFGHPLALLMLDLDRFKLVNDAHGHARGDAVLRELARRLAEEVREVDVLARYGGEEFVLVLPETDGEGAARLAQRVVHLVRREPFVEGGPPLAVTVSIGVAVHPTHGTTASALMHSADLALYSAKAAGRDGWAFPPGAATATTAG